MTLEIRSPEDKPYWCERGERHELDFVHLLAPAYGLAAEINPAKRFDRFAPDLLLNGAAADLKSQRTPFFTAARYGLDPQFTVTLNVVDIERYAAINQDLAILFWVRWDTLRRQWHQRIYSVRPMEGIWRTSVRGVLEHVDSGKAPLHHYVNRIDDKRGNAKASYLLDLGWIMHVPHLIRSAA